MPNSPINVLIIGAGTGGLCLAQGLKPPELYQTLLATCAQPPVYANQLTHRMKFLFSAGPEVLKEGDQPPEADRDESVSRMTLRQVLLTGVEDVVHFDKVFSHYEQHPDGTVTACFEDGTSATGDVLVAADGANSRVRRQCLPHAQLVDTGLIGITGKTPLTPETRPAPLAGSPGLACGPGCG
jgi:2-polyprenyl-6-methoxyphenol hydroxylase-like FAD-dependent oxidoreductase